MDLSIKNPDNFKGTIYLNFFARLRISLPVFAETTIVKQGEDCEVYSKRTAIRFLRVNKGVCVKGSDIIV